tara:strand:+ start:1015 stop:1410 length:396 start_codon:yes stop_codon:yes gene_type:complete
MAYVQKNNPFPVTGCGRRRTFMTTDNPVPVFKDVDKSKGIKVDKSKGIKVKPVKAKGGGTKKVCLPKAKIASMSKAERQKVINAKKTAAAKGDYKRSSKSNVKGTKSKNLKDWFAQDWRQVGDPSKKCGEA